MYYKEFVLRHVFKNVENMKEGQNYYSEWKEHYNVKWRMYIRKNKDDFILFLKADLFEKADQFVTASYNLRIISANENVLSKDASKDEFSSKSDSRGWTKFTDWKNVTDNFLIDGNLKIEAHVTVLKMTGIPRRSFGEDAMQFSDVALVVKREHFFVSKLFLSSQSTYFEALFMGSFQESEQSQVELKDVEAKDLQNFLEVVYGESSIDDDTVGGILSLADMYITRTVVQKCEEFLTRDSQKELKEKLNLAARFKLGDLKKSCMEKIKTVADVRAVAPSDPNEMDNEILTSLLQKVLTLV